MARRRVTGRASEFAGRQPLDKYTNITNAATVRGLIRSGGPISGSASGVRSISSVDAFNTLGQFFIGEALGIGLAAGAAKIVGLAAPKIGRAASGARPMTTAERSAAVTRAGRTGVGKIGPSIKPKNPNTYKGENWDGDFMEPFDSYSDVYSEAAEILRRRGRPTPNDLVGGYSRRFFEYSGLSRDSRGVQSVTQPLWAAKTEAFASRAPLRRVASVKRRNVR